MSDYERDPEFFEKNGIPNGARLLPSRFTTVKAVGRVSDLQQVKLNQGQEAVRARELAAFQMHDERTSPGMFGYDSDSDDPEENPNAGIRLA